MRLSNSARMTGWGLAVVLGFALAIGETALGQGAWNGAWATLTPMPTARHAMAVGEIDGYLYVVGGCCPGSAANERYDPKTDTWQSKAPLPQSIDYFGTNGAVVDGIMYLIGGNAGGFCTGANWAYNSATNTWTAKASMPTARCHMAVVAVNGIIYAIGGTNTSGSAWYNIVEAYNPATNSWSTKTPMPTGRSILAAGVLKGLIYVVGGSNPATSDKVEAYNPATNSWSTKASLPTPRAGLGVEVANGLLYAFGGFGSGGFLTNVDAYDPTTNTWSAKTSMTSCRAGSGCGSVDGAIYIFGGYGNCPPPEVDYTLVQAFLTPTAPSTCPTDVNGDGTRNFDDILAIIFEYGPCP